MGVRTHLNGIRLWHFEEFLKRRTLDNLYTSYAALSEAWRMGKKLPVQENLTEKAKEGFISLEELVAGGRATRLFVQAGPFQEAVKRLSRKRAANFISGEGKLKRFLFSGRTIVPYVVEQLPAEEIAVVLHRAAKPITQRSVADLKEIGRFRRSADFASIALAVNYELDYDERPITTAYFPHNLADLFYFKRPAARVREINRGLVITDNFVANMSGILDALGRLRISPLDSILIGLRLLQGHGLPKTPVLRLPEFERKEIQERDHFTEKARATLHRAVCEEFERMKSDGGDEKTFRVYIDRSTDFNGKPIYRVQIAWDKKEEL